MRDGEDCPLEEEAVDWVLSHILPSTHQRGFFWFLWVDSTWALTMLAGGMGHEEASDP